MQPLNQLINLNNARIVNLNMLVNLYDNKHDDGTGTGAVIINSGTGNTFNGMPLADNAQQGSEIAAADGGHGVNTGSGAAYVAVAASTMALGVCATFM